MSVIPLGEVSAAGAEKFFETVYYEVSIYGFVCFSWTVILISNIFPISGVRGGQKYRF